MRLYKSFLSSKFQEYITYRKGLGFENTNLMLSLSYLDRYLNNKELNWDSLTPSFFLNFRASLKLNPRTVNGIIGTISGFFNYLQRMEFIKENPLSDIPPIKEFHFMPFVFSKEQIEQLLIAIQKKIRKDEKYFLPDLAKYTAIVLLARCGLRISEPTRLLITHYRPDDATIYIEKTKFKKDRLIPIPARAASEIDNYLATRKSLLLKDDNPYLLAIRNQKLTRGQLYPVFHQAVKDIGINQSKKTYENTTFGGPTPHSFRHAFAINTLASIKKRGKSPQNALPVLAVYLGHCHYINTAVYLKVVDPQQCVELLNFAKARHLHI
jgi:integrase/recombinase XerD